MPFTITKVELKDGVEIALNQIAVPFSSKTQAWAAASDEVGCYAEWDIDPKLRFLWCRENGTTYRYYVHDSRFPPEQVNSQPDLQPATL